jgi:hypothetical protein
LATALFEASKIGYVGRTEESIAEMILLVIFLSFCSFYVLFIVTILVRGSGAAETPSCSHETSQFKQCQFLFIKQNESPLPNWLMIQVGLHFETPLHILFDQSGADVFQVV